MLSVSEAPQHSFDLRYRPKVFNRYTVPIRGFVSQ